MAPSPRPKISPSISGEELIQLDPAELRIPAMLNRTMLLTVNIVNTTDFYVAFHAYWIQRIAPRDRSSSGKGILPPRSTTKYIISWTTDQTELQAMEPSEDLFVWNRVVTEGFESGDIISYMVEEESKKLPFTLTKTGSSISGELIQFDPPELHFPFLPNKKVLTSIKIVNLTDYNVGFNTYSWPANAAWYHTEPPRGILRPRSTQKLMVTREQKEDALKDNQFDDKYFVWKSIVSDGVKDSELSDYMAEQESKELPIILDKVSSSISRELIQFDPAENCIPHLLNKTMLFNVNVINITDCYVAFNAYWMEKIAPRDRRSKEEGIMPPRSTKRITLGWVTVENELEDVEANGGYFVWNRVVTERVESEDIISYMDEEESKKVTLILNKKASPSTSNELIQFDPPELSLPFVPNKPLVFSVNILNTTEYYVGFADHCPLENVGWYHVEPNKGVIPPRSTQRIVAKRVSKKKEQEDVECEDKFYVWSNLVSEGVHANDLLGHAYIRDTKELPIVYRKTSLCTLDELIQLDPPQLPFPFSTNKSVPTLGIFKIINVTDQSVGFSTWGRDHVDNSALYGIEPQSGILPPRTAQTIKVTRTLKENVTEDMQCKDKIFVWNGIVTEDIKVSDVGIYWKDEDKELPIVLTKEEERKFWKWPWKN